MSTFKARGLVIKDITVGEADKILTLILKDTGKLTVSARGARKPKSKFLAGTQLFSYADFVIYNGGKFCSLCETSPIKSFHEIANDFEKLAHGSLILEIADKTLLDQLPCDEILYLIIITLARLSNSSNPPSLISTVFEIKYLQLHGYAPVTECCSNCDNHSLDSSYLYLGSNGLLCRACASKSRAIRISSDTLLAIDYILDSDIKNIFSFKADSGTTRQLQIASKLLMDSHFDIRFKCRDFISNELD